MTKADFINDSPRCREALPIAGFTLPGEVAPATAGAKPFTQFPPAAARSLAQTSNVCAVQK